MLMWGTIVAVFGRAQVAKKVAKVVAPRHEVQMVLEGQESPSFWKAIGALLSWRSKAI